MEGGKDEPRGSKIAVSPHRLRSLTMIRSLEEENCCESVLLVGSEGWQGKKEQRLEDCQFTPLCNIRHNQLLKRKLPACRLQALAGAKAGIQRLQEAGVAWLRPHDYYAEMVKSDGHMARIKQQLVYEQKQIEEADER
jgi:hypothetical protein